MKYEKPVRDFYYDSLNNTYVDADILSQFFTKVFAWMFLGLTTTMITTVVTINSPLIRILYSGSRLPIISMLLIELGISFYIFRSDVITITINRTRTLFMVYSFINGITLSFIPLIYNSTVVILALSAASLLFGIMALYGYLTKDDFTKYRSILRISFILLITFSIINLFLRFSFLELILSYIGAVIALFAICYDVNNLKNIALSATSELTQMDKYAVKGALALYINFINLFLRLLQIIDYYYSKNRRKER